MCCYCICKKARRKRYVFETGSYLASSSEFFIICIFYTYKLLLFLTWLNPKVYLWHKISGCANNNLLSVGPQLNQINIQLLLYEDSIIKLLFIVIIIRSCIIQTSHNNYEDINSIHVN